MFREGSPGKDGYNYWKCPGDGCGAFFDDRNGGPDPVTIRRSVTTSVKCPKCGMPLQHKTKPPSSGKGYNYWLCTGASCKASFEDSEGSPGEPKAAVTSTLSSHICSDCGKPLRHMIKPGDNGYDFWGCSGYPACRATYPDAGGVPGPKNPPRQQVSGFKCVRCGADLLRRKGTSHKTGQPFDFFSCSNTKCRAIYETRNDAPDVPEAVLKRLAAANQNPADRGR
jgi:ssDNA-binding Zn-finger/Zn-ribbon topoisomerase 1